MDKEEILKRVKSDRPGLPDEMEMQTNQEGGQIAMCIMLVVAIILMVVKIVVGQPWYDVYSVMFAGTAGVHLYKGIKLHQRHEMLLGTVSGLVALLALVGAIWEYLG